METKTEKERVRSLSKDQKLLKQEEENLALKDHQLAVAEGVEEPDTTHANIDHNFKINTAEAAGYVHVWTEVRHVAQDQKTVSSETRIIKIHARQFDEKVREGMFLQYDEAKVIHDPRPNKPSSYNLKPAIGQFTPQSANPNLAARERDLAVREQQLKQQEDEIKNRLENIKRMEQEALSSSARLKTASESQGATANATGENPVNQALKANKQEPAETIKPAPVVTEQSTDFPDLNNLGESGPGPETTTTTKSGKGKGKSE